MVTWSRVVVIRVDEFEMYLRSLVIKWGSGVEEVGGVKADSQVSGWSLVSII